MSAVIDDCWNRNGVWGDQTCPKLKEHTHCRNCAVFSAAAAVLLNREIPAGYREEWTGRTAIPRIPKASGLKPIVIFRVGQEWLALPAAVIEEVAESRPVHTLPHRDGRTVKGVVNIRGELLVCISLPDLLGFESEPGDARLQQGRRAIYRRLLVAAHSTGRVAFPVEEVYAGLRYRPEELKTVPSTVAGAYAVGILPWEERNVGVLDSELLFYTVDRSLA